MALRSPPWSMPVAHGIPADAAGRGWMVAPVALVIAGGIAALFTFRVTSPHDVTVLVVGALALVLLAAAAVTAVSRFALFVLGVLAVRSVLDLVEAAVGVADITSALGGALMLALVAHWLANRGSHDRRHRAPVASAWAATALLLAALLSATIATDPVRGMTEAARLASVMAMFAAVLWLLRDGLRPQLVIVTLFASAVGPIAVGTHQHLTGSGLVVIDDTLRVRGTFVHPNSFAMYLAIVVVFAAAMLAHESGWTRTALVALLAAALPMLMLTYTRSAWLAVVVGVLVVAWPHSRSLVVVIVVAAVAASLLIPSMASRWSDLSETRRASGDAGNSLVWRLEHWDTSVEQAADRPVTGIGLGNTGGLTEGGRQLHNDLVRAYVEVGAIGVLAYLALLATLARDVVRARRRARDGLERALAGGAAGVLAALVVVSLSDNVMSQTSVVWYGAAVLAMAAHVARAHTPVAGTAP